MGHHVRRLDLFVTEACNLACPYCFALTSERRHISPADARRAVDWLLESEHPRVHITFWGGEPLLRRELMRELVGYARRAARSCHKELSLALPTNGTLLDDETLGWLYENDVVLFVSIDGDATAQQGRPLAQGGCSHRAAAAGLSRALEMARALGRRPPAARMTVTPQNAAGLVESVAFLQQLGAREAMVYPAFDAPWSRADLEAFDLGQRALARWLISQIEVAPQRAIAVKPWTSLLRTLRGDRGPRRHDEPLGACRLGDALVAVSVDGRFSPCHRLVTYDSRGALDLGRLDEARAPARHGEATIVEQESTDGRRCVECEHFGLCSYNCPAISYATTGALDRVPGHVCDMMASQAAACMELAARLEGDPRLALYLEGSLAGELQRTVRDLGQRSLAHYHALQQSSYDQKESGRE